MLVVFRLGIFFVVMGWVSGCDMYSAGSINKNPIQISKEFVSKSIFVVNVSDDVISDIARHYTKYSDSPMELVVTYDPKSQVNSAMWASNKVSDIAGILRGYGVTNLSAKILPVNLQGEGSQLFVSYYALSARAPKGCDIEMAGIDGDLERLNPDYKLGCAIDKMTALQVAKPAHLLGRGAVSNVVDGRATSNIIDGYRAGAQNDRLEGLNASND